MKVDIGAAFAEGFRVIGREPLSLVGWALAAVACNILQLLAMVGSGGAMTAGALFNLERIRAGQLAGSMAGALIVMYLVLAAVGLVFFAVLGSAIYRSTFDPNGSRAWARLRLTRAEWLFALSLFLLSLIYIAWSIASLVIVRLFTQMGALGGLLILCFTVFSGLSFVSLFAFVGPMTIDKGRFCFGQAVAAAGRQYWRLMAVNLLLALLALALYILAAVLVIAFVGGTFASLSRGDPQLVREALLGMLFSPVTWFLLLVALPLAAIAVEVLFVAPAARAYADSQGSTAHQIDVFN